MSKINVTNIEADSIKNELSTNGGITISSTGQVSIPDLATPTTASEPATKAYVDSSGVSDGDKGDITVSNSGATWTIDNDVVGADELTNTGVTAGSYTTTNLTVDAQGRITAASNGSAGAATSSWNSVGSYASMYRSNPASTSPGNTVSGGYLRACSFDGNSNYGLPGYPGVYYYGSGTWRLMGGHGNGTNSPKNPTLWHRIS